MNVNTNKKIYIFYFLHFNNFLFEKKKILFDKHYILILLYFNVLFIKIKLIIY